MLWDEAQQPKRHVCALPYVQQTQPECSPARLPLRVWIWCGHFNWSGPSACSGVIQPGGRCSAQRPCRSTRLEYGKDACSAGRLSLRGAPLAVQPRAPGACVAAACVTAAAACDSTLFARCKRRVVVACMASRAHQRLLLLRRSAAVPPPQGAVRRACSHHSSAPRARCAASTAQQRLARGDGVHSGASSSVPTAQRVIKRR
jgi:hypothetical protein